MKILYENAEAATPLIIISIIWLKWIYVAT